MAELGWVDGQNVRIESRYAEGQPERYPGFFAELLRLNVDVIVAGGGTPAARAAKQATSTTPIVMFATDPVTAGLVASLARPGGNMTGFASLNPEMSAKRLGLLKEAFPKVERVAVLCDPADIGEAGAIEAAARSFGGRVQVLSASRVEEFNGAFEAAKQARAEALLVCASPFFNTHRKHVVDLAGQHRLAAIYEHRDFVAAGGLMSYGPNLVEMYRGAARYVDKILKGANRPTCLWNSPPSSSSSSTSKTAKALGSRSRRRCWRGRMRSSNEQRGARHGAHDKPARCTARRRGSGAREVPRSGSSRLSLVRDFRPHRGIPAGSARAGVRGGEDDPHRVALSGWKLDRLPSLAAELVRLNVDVIVTGGPSATRPAKAATVTIPIVMTNDSDPVANGFVASLARPGGNITGLSTVSPEMYGKRLELLKQIVPTL